MPKKRSGRAARLAEFSLEAAARAGGLIDFPELQKIIPRHPTWFRRREQLGLFPRRLILGRTVQWNAREIVEFLRTAPRGPMTKSAREGRA